DGICLVAIARPKKIPTITTIKQKEPFARSLPFKVGSTQSLHPQGLLFAERRKLLDPLSVEIIGSEKDFAARLDSLLIDSGLIDYQRQTVPGEIEDDQVILVRSI